MKVNNPSCQGNNNNQSIIDFYDKYPFPQNSESDIRQRAGRIEILFRKNGILDTFPNKPLILDAGCGTGINSNSMALAFPKAQVIGLNINHKSIEYAETQAQAMNLSNVKYFVADIFDLPTHITSLSFDLIWSQGVLHHTHSVKKGVKILTSLGNSNGFFILSLYHIGRWKIFLMRLLLTLLAGRNIDKRLGMAKTLFPKSVKKHCGNRIDNQLRDVVIADKFCVPRETYHTYWGIRRMLKKCFYDTLACSLDLDKMGKRETFFRKILFSSATDNDPKQYLISDLKGFFKRQEQFTLFCRKGFR